MSDDRPQPDQIEGAPHPREAEHVYGQDAAVAQFLESYHSGKLHSGWMISGPQGIGKATLAWKIAAFLIAGAESRPSDSSSLDVPEDHPDMRLIQSGAHPRLYVVRRAYDEKAKKLRSEITVDTVRGIKSFFQMSVVDGGRRVVIVDCADEMNKNAANAILKELEEPPAQTVMLLVTHQPSGLLPTIRSRCRMLKCAPLSSVDLSLSLEQAGLGHAVEQGVSILANGSAGYAVRLQNHDGLGLYHEWMSLFKGDMGTNRVSALSLADSCVGVANSARFSLLLELVETFLARVAHCGVFGAPSMEVVAGEGQVLSRLSVNQYAAQEWARLQHEVSARMRHGLDVNLDPSALILDMVLQIEAVARRVAQ